MAAEALSPKKRCTKCGFELPLDAFAKAKTGVHGRRSDCRECRAHYNAKWYADLTPDKRAARFNNPRHKAYMAAYAQQNAERGAELKRRWMENNIDKHRASVRAAMRRRRATAKGQLESNVGRAVHRALKGQKNGEPSFALLAFSVEQLMAHLERQFTPGMSWQNYGKWHLDHILPLASFDYQVPSDPGFAQAWALANLRPLWAKENISKGARRLLLI